MRDNLAIVFKDKHDLKLEKTPMPEKPLPNEVTLKSAFCGICGTDVHLWEEGKVANFIAEKPFILGHEVSATVEAIGEKVTHLKIGDKVAVEPAIPCADCNFCRTGLYNLCYVCNKNASGLPPRDGFLHQYFNHPANFCYKLSDDISLEEAAFSEPLAVAVYANKRVNVSLNQTILVCGAGNMGILSMMTAKAYGAGKICIIDIDEAKLKLAKKLGADETLLIGKNSPPAEVAGKVQLLLGKPPEIVLECTGNGNCINVAIHALENGGKIAMVGIGPETVSVSLGDATLKEIDLIGICRFRNAYPDAVHFMNTKRIDVKPLISHVFEMKDYMEAFKTMKSGTSNKVMIKCN